MVRDQMVCLGLFFSLQSYLFPEQALPKLSAGEQAADSSEPAQVYRLGHSQAGPAAEEFTVPPEMGPWL